MNKTRIQFLAIFLCIFYVAVSPYITVYQIKSAAERKDGEALSEYVDFVSLRQNFKDQMNAMFMREMDSQEMKDNPFAMLGVAFAGMMVDRAVETYVTPAGITQLMAGRTPNLDQKGDSEQNLSEVTTTPFSDAELSYESFSKFAVTVRRDAGEIKFVLRRRGIGWKITEIILPLERDRSKQIVPNIQDTEQSTALMLEEQSDDAPRLEQRSPTQWSYLPDSTTSPTTSSKTPNEPTQAELRAAVQLAERNVAGAESTTEVDSRVAVDSFITTKDDVISSADQPLDANSRNDVDRVINQAKGRLQIAYQRGLDDDPTMQGNVVVRLKIKPDGMVSSVSIVSSALNNRALEERFLTILRGLTFKAGDFAEWNNTYTLNFIPL